MVLVHSERHTTVIDNTDTDKLAAVPINQKILHHRRAHLTSGAAVH